MSGTKNLESVATYIAGCGWSIYDNSPSSNEAGYYTNPDLEDRVREKVVGTSLAGLPLRTRSKVAKAAVCRALGYPVPASFKKTQPRFPSPNFDLYVQKSNNLQVWNEEVDPERRYLVLGLDAADSVTSVRVLSGQELALLDSTGTLTSKLQASRRSVSGSLLVSRVDTENFVSNLEPIAAGSQDQPFHRSPILPPRRGQVFTISSLYDRLLPLVGRELSDPGITQERNRGALLQQLICESLDLGPYADKGQFPDILSQALEVKLQLARTIDLGLVSPSDTGTAEELGKRIRYCDTRYAIFFADRLGSDKIKLTDLVLTSGIDFFEEFRQFEGRVQNRKLQIRLPDDFFRNR